MYTVEQARAMECPQRVEANLLHDSCSGSKCMAWRFVPVVGENGAGERGYCGLAGAPADVAVEIAVEAARKVRAAI